MTLVHGARASWRGFRGAIITAALKLLDLYPPENTPAMVFVSIGAPMELISGFCAAMEWSSDFPCNTRPGQGGGGKF